MRVVIEYMLREFWRYFLLLLGIFVFIYLLVDFLDRVDNFIEYQSSFGDVLAYYSYKLPMILLQVTAASVLLSVIITLAIMNRNNEIVALKAAGISVYRLSIPFLFVGLFISLITFSLAEGVVPYTNAQASQLWYHGMRHNNSVQEEYFGKFKGWYRSEKAIFNVKRLRKKDRAVEWASLFFFDNNYRLIRRVEAKEGRYHKGKWTFYDGVDKAIGTDGKFRVSKFKELAILLTESPEAFQYVSKSSDEMSLAELDAYIDQLNREGYDTTAYKVDRMVKFSLPFVPLVLTLLAIPLALSQNREVSMAQPVGLGVAVTFAYIVVFGLSRSLGLAGTLPIVLAAWLPNITFGLAGAYMLVSLRQ